MEPVTASRLRSIPQAMEAIRVVLMLAEQVGQWAAQGIEGPLGSGHALAGSLERRALRMVTGGWRASPGRQPVRPQLGLHHPEGAGLDGVRNARDGPGDSRGAHSGAPPDPRAWPPVQRRCGWWW